MAKRTVFSDLAVMTQQEIGRRLGLSRARVMQIEQRALAKMAAEAERLGLRTLLEEDGSAQSEESLSGLPAGVRGGLW